MRDREKANSPTDFSLALPPFFSLSPFPHEIDCCNHQEKNLCTQHRKQAHPLFAVIPSFHLSPSCIYVCEQPDSPPVRECLNISLLKCTAAVPFETNGLATPTESCTHKAPFPAPKIESAFLSLSFLGGPASTSCVFFFSRFCVFHCPSPDCQ